ncbi:E3 ubiquitin-protein ligase MARCHF7 isoform X2 [Ornithorhynchus anatinus]|uniref:E3 ubiquitin-protein ligase MARCHF7 n=1 Tax=Ornithorhynchus anatinus TaxID=9258 RepID=A0A6I8NWY3_ORNAN|nr:E3 ubiquitin-protein ligase MARCHF7 isoform X2 [Ornithorhynchus anatinus]
MESKPSRIPRRISVQPPGSALSARMSGSRGGDLSEAYNPRESSFRLDSEHQESNYLQTSGRDWGLGEREGRETPWKLNSSSPTRYSGTFEPPWSGSFLGNRSRLPSSSSSSSSTTPFQSTWYSESERTQGAYPRLQNQQRNYDSKRPKLSYTGCTSTSTVRSNGSGVNAVADSSWRHSQVPRSSSVILGSLGTELVRERRNQERRADLVDYSHRNGDFTSSSYLQDRVTSSYSQGARPKESSLNTLRLNTSSMNRQLPSEHQSSVYLRDPNRSSSRSNFAPREMESPQRSAQPGFAHISSRNETPSSTGSSERAGSSQRSLSEPSTDTEGRRTTRQLLSRLASSMSSTFFSRRSSQDSFNSRSLESESSFVAPRVHTSTQSSSSAAPPSEVPDSRTSEASQGFRFLRRRWGLTSMVQNHSSDADCESFRHEPESRNAGSWLSSSIRNRCTPLFSRRRREGRDESSRTSTSDIPSRSQHLFRRRESSEEVSLEAQSSSPGTATNRPQTPAVSSTAASAVSTPDLTHSGRNTGIPGILPGSLFRFAVPPALGSNLSDNVMITVDIIPSGWNPSDGQSDKSKPAPSRDPERLQKIKESLLLEDSEDEEGDLCRICQMAAASSSNLLIEPCKCTGSLQYVHQECMKKWLQAKINSGSSLEAVTTCELCKEKLQLNLEDFDIHELYRAHANEQAEYEFISSGLYLVVLLHLCEQRFSDMLGTASEANTHVRLQRMIPKKMETTTELSTLPNA